MLDFCFPKNLFIDSVSFFIGMLRGESIMSKNFMILITFLAKKMLLRLAYIFGKISPQSKMKKVTNPTSQITLNQLLNPLKRNSPIGAKISTIDIFTKLLAISIVANNFLGFFSILTISLLVLLSLSSSLFKSV